VDPQSAQGDRALLRAVHDTRSSFRPRTERPSSPL
jgi:hypothetical protein